MKIIIKSLLLVFIISIFLYSQEKYGIIKGRVLDSVSGEPLCPVNIIIDDLKKGCLSDHQGFYTLEKVPLGKHSITYSLIAHCSINDSVNIDSLFPYVNKDVYLSRALIPLIVPDSLKEYHSYISTLNPKDILEIQIDSITSDAEFISITIKNISTIPVYLIEDLPCFRAISVLVKDDSGKVIKRNILNMGCDVIGLNYLPQINNLKRLEPNQSISFNDIRTWYNLSNYSLPGRKYFVSAYYEIKEFEYLPGAWGCPGDQNYSGLLDEKYILGRATRGKYESINEIVFEK